MTGRHATAYLPRREDIDPALRRKSASDWAHVLFYGAIGWPFLLRSLSGGSKAARTNLLARLDLPEAALPNLGSWKADAGFLTLVAETILAQKPPSVVELGCGATSLVAARALALAGGGDLVGFDQHEDYVASVRSWLSGYGLDASLFAAPLTRTDADWPGRWYDLADRAPERIGLLIVDGPPWAVHPFVRGAAETLFPRLSPGGLVLLDDADRPGERVIAARWRKRWPDFEFRLARVGAKGTLVGRRVG